MSDSSIYFCPHEAEFILQFSCRETGNYLLKLCKNCRDKESREFLIFEEKIK